MIRLKRVSEKPQGQKAPLSYRVLALGALGVATLSPEERRTARSGCPTLTGSGFSRRRLGREGRGIGLARTLLACGLRGCDWFARLRLAWGRLRLWAIGLARKRLSFFRRYPGRCRLLPLLRPLL